VNSKFKIISILNTYKINEVYARQRCILFVYLNKKVNVTYQIYKPESPFELKTSLMLYETKKKEGSISLFK